MPFDANIVLADDDADWTYANLVSSDYGTPTSTTRNSGGFAVIDLGGTNIGAAASGIAVVLVLTEAAAASDDALTVIVEESSTEIFTVPHELAKFDILAATKGVIIGSETPAAVIRRISPTLRYLRIDASCVSGDDFKTCYCLLSPYPFRGL